MSDQRHDRPPAGRARILEITSYPPPRAGWGVRVSFLRRRLEAQGHACEVLNTGRSRRIRSPEYIDVQNGWDYLVKVVRWVRRCHVVHTHINGDGNKGWALALVAQLVARLWGRECVLTFHAGPRQRHFPREQSRLCVPFFRSVFGLARLIICNSAAVKECIQAYGVPSSKIHPIPAFSRQYLAYTPSGLRPELEAFVTGRAPVLAAYFFLRPEFFVESLLEAVGRLARRYRRLGVVMVGEDTRSPAFGVMLRKAGIAEHVYCAGDLNHDEFMTLLSRIHLYVRTPAKDGVCSSVLEALSLSIPVVASENGQRPAGVITFHPGSADSLADAIESTWERYAAVRASLVKPDVQDTLAVEADLLIALARGIIPGASPTARHCGGSVEDHLPSSHTR